MKELGKKRTLCGDTTCEEFDALEAQIIEKDVEITRLWQAIGKVLPMLDGSTGMEVAVLPKERTARAGGPNFVTIIGLAQELAFILRSALNDKPSLSRSGLVYDKERRTIVDSKGKSVGLKISAEDADMFVTSHKCPICHGTNLMRKPDGLIEYECSFCGLGFTKERVEG